LPDKSAVRK